MFGMGCFWAPQDRFDTVPGVVSTTVGYGWASLGPAPSRVPTYDSVCGGDGFTEALRVEFDPSVISYDTLLDRFFDFHDATIDLGPDATGGSSQYMSVIWAQNEEKALVARNQLAARSTTDKPPSTIVRGMEPRQVEEEIAGSVVSTFHPAERYHQNFWPKMWASLGLIATCLATSAASLRVTPRDQWLTC